ncbi:MAG: hypothetical protein IPG43_04450 [Proteobacteria bacterium]|nr:hypothetical protein [Pseudomonadota bacterium]
MRTSTTPARTPIMTRLVALSALLLTCAQSNAAFVQAAGQFSWGTLEVSLLGSPTLDYVISDAFGTAYADSTGLPSQTRTVSDWTTFSGAAIGGASTTLNNAVIFVIAKALTEPGARPLTTDVAQGSRAADFTITGSGSGTILISMVADLEIEIADAKAGDFGLSAAGAATMRLSKYLPGSDQFASGDNTYALSLFQAGFSVNQNAHERAVVALGVQAGDVLHFSATVSAEITAGSLGPVSGGGTVVPLPASLWLLSAAMATLGMVGKRVV